MFQNKERHKYKKETDSHTYRRKMRETGERNKSWPVEMVPRILYTTAIQ